MLAFSQLSRTSHMVFWVSTKGNIKCCYSQQELGTGKQKKEVRRDSILTELSEYKLKILI